MVLGRVCRRTRPRSGGARRARPARTPRRDHPDRLSRRPRGAHSEGAQRARCQSACRHPARLGVWRASALLDLPGARAARLGTLGAAVTRRNPGADPARRGSRGPAGVPAQTDGRYQHLAAAAARNNPARGGPAQRHRNRGGTLCGDPVCRHPRLGPTGREPFALRCRLHPQPFFRGGRQRHQSTGTWPT